MKPKKKLEKCHPVQIPMQVQTVLSLHFCKKKKRLLFFIFPNPPAELLNVLNTPKWCQDGLNEMCYRFKNR